MRTLTLAILVMVLVSTTDMQSTGPHATASCSTGAVWSTSLGGSSLVVGADTSGETCGAPFSELDTTTPPPFGEEWFNPDTNNTLCWSYSTNSYERCLRFDRGQLVDSTTGNSITIADLASFTPVSGELITEPGEWSAIGAPTNVYVTTTQHEQPGTLLGQPVTVRWIPSTFTFDYGDGTVITVDEPGHPWHPNTPWAETPTTHTYTTTGDHTITVTVAFRAQVQFDGTWVDVAGTLPVTLPPHTIRIVRIDTVLVRGDCNAYPNDPGCS